MAASTQEKIDMLKLGWKLGEADDLLVGQLVVTGGDDTAYEHVKAARTYVRSTAGTSFLTDYANSITLASAFNTILSTMTSNLNGTLTAAVTALNTYCTTVNGASFKSWFQDIRLNNVTAATEPSDETYTWPNEFRALWRRVRNEELMVRVSTIHNTSDVWAVTADDGTHYNSRSLVIPTAMVLYVGNTVGGSDPITGTITFDTKDAGGNALTVVIPLSAFTNPTGIPVATAAATVYTIALGTTYTTFTGVNSISLTGGTDGDELLIYSI